MKRFALPLIFTLPALFIISSCDIANNEDLTLADFGYCVVTASYFDGEDYFERYEYQNGYQLIHLLESYYDWRDSTLINDTLAIITWDGPYIESVKSINDGYNSYQRDTSVSYYHWVDGRLVKISHPSGDIQLSYDDDGHLRQLDHYENENHNNTYTSYPQYKYFWNHNNIVRVEAYRQGELKQVTEITHTHQRNMFQHFSWIHAAFSPEAISFTLSVNEIAKVTEYLYNNGEIIGDYIIRNINDFHSVYNEYGFPVSYKSMYSDGNEYTLFFEYENCPDQDGNISDPVNNLAAPIRPFSSRRSAAPTDLGSCSNKSECPYVIPSLRIRSFSSKVSRGRTS